MEQYFVLVLLSALVLLSTSVHVSAGKQQLFEALLSTIWVGVSWSWLFAVLAVDVFRPWPDQGSLYSSVVLLCCSFFLVSTVQVCAGKQPHQLSSVRKESMRDNFEING